MMTTSVLAGDPTLEAVISPAAVSLAASCEIANHRGTCQAVIKRGEPRKIGHFFKADLHARLVKRLVAMERLHACQEM